MNLSFATECQRCIIKLRILLSTLFNRLRRNPICNAIAFLVCNIFQRISFYERKKSLSNRSSVMNRIQGLRHHVFHTNCLESTCLERISISKFQLILIEDSSSAMRGILMTVVVLVVLVFQTFSNSWLSRWDKCGQNARFIWEWRWKLFVLSM